MSDRVQGRIRVVGIGVVFGVELVELEVGSVEFENRVRGWF